MNFCRVVTLAIFIFGCGVLHAQTEAIPVYSCENPGIKAITSGLGSTNLLQGIVPFCKVEVFMTGTTNHATIFKDSSSTPQDNPFTANLNGSIQSFYAATGQCYDVNLSGGILPNAYTSPVTLTGVCVGVGGAAGGGVASLNGQTGAQTVVGDATVTVTPNGSNQIALHATSTSPVKVYRAYGDSLTQGDDLASVVGAYPFTIAANLGIPVTNRGISGYTSNEVDPLIFADTNLIAQDSAGLSTYAIGTNNVNVGGNDVNQASMFGQNVFAQYAFLAIPNSAKTLATSFGTTGLSSAGYFSVSRKLTASGTFTFSATGSIVYLATVIQQSGTGSATLSCDGTIITQTGLSTMYFGGIGGESPSLPQTSLSRFAGLANSIHSCVVTWVSGTVELAWAAGISGSPQGTYPHVLLANIPPRNPDTLAPYETLYRSAQNSMAAQLMSDGLTNIVMEDLNDGTFSSPSLYNDSYHFTTYGYYLEAQKFIATLDSIFSSSNLVNQEWIGDPLSNLARYQMGNMQVGWRNRTAPDWTGNYNTSLGYYGCSNLATGSNVTCLGNASGASDVGSSNMTFLGAGSDQVGTGLYVGSTAVGALAVVNASHRIMLGDPSIVDVFLGNGQGVLTTNNAPIVMSHTGNQFFGGPHIITDFVVLSGGAATVSLSGLAVYTNNTTYSCSANDASIPTNTAGWNKSSSSGTFLVFSGTASDTITYICVGN